MHCTWNKSTSRSCRTDVGEVKILNAHPLSNPARGTFSDCRAVKRDERNWSMHSITRNLTAVNSSSWSPTSRTSWFVLQPHSVTQLCGGAEQAFLSLLMHQVPLTPKVYKQYMNLWNTWLRMLHFCQDIKNEVHEHNTCKVLQQTRNKFSTRWMCFNFVLLMLRRTVRALDKCDTHLVSITLIGLRTYLKHPFNHT